ncbi:hypothetical protein RHCRD62_50173 [Rhodococcus sp. RD6.2]|nr:hypothetical protein RHCRD62_50173 [Rhodococcus sp. RD6.2]
MSRAASTPVGGVGQAEAGRTGIESVTAPAWDRAWSRAALVVAVLAALVVGVFTDTAQAPIVTGFGTALPRG